MVPYEVNVQSTLLNRCETWAISESDVRKLKFQMKYSQKYCCFSLSDRIPNTEILSECQVPLMHFNYRCLRWLGHVARMDNVKLPLQMMFSTLMGSGARALPMKI